MFRDAFQYLIISCRSTLQCFQRASMFPTVFYGSRKFSGLELMDASIVNTPSSGVCLLDAPPFSFETRQLASFTIRLAFSPECRFRDSRTTSRVIRTSTITIGNRLLIIGELFLAFKTCQPFKMLRLFKTGTTPQAAAATEPILSYAK